MVYRKFSRVISSFGRWARKILIRLSVSDPPYKPQKRADRAGKGRGRLPTREYKAVIRGCVGPQGERVLLRRRFQSKDGW